VGDACFAKASSHVFQSASIQVHKKSRHITLPILNRLSQSYQMFIERVKWLDAKINKRFEVEAIDLASPTSCLPAR